MDYVKPPIFSVPILCILLTAILKVEFGNGTSTGGNQTGGVPMVNQGGVWAEICGDGVDVKDATVICRTLGYGHYLHQNRRWGYLSSDFIHLSTGNKKHLFFNKILIWVEISKKKYPCLHKISTFPRKLRYFQTIILGM